MEIQINLWNDYVSALRNHVAACGFHLTGAETDEAIVIGFFNWQKRIVGQVPRKIHRSQEFNCAEEYRKSIADIIKAIEGGQDLTLYLSKKVGNLDYSDLMLNDWGIHHIHLGQSVDQSGFITRTGALLFLRFTESDAYFVNVFDHGAWSKQEIVMTIHRNWPDLIKRYRVTGVIGLEHNLTDDDITNLREAHINTMLQLSDGTVYAPIGMGSMTDGTAIDVMMRLTNTKRTLRNAEDAVRKAAIATPESFSGCNKLHFFL